MPFDLSPFTRGELKAIEFVRQYQPTTHDLKAVTNKSLDTILDIIRDLTDADVIFDPIDPEANDPHAKPGEEKIGWSIAHLVAHVTASSEEWATYSSILARGIRYTPEPRLRYETDWRDITTKAQCVQRIEESRRMRLAYLETWPDRPQLDVYRELSPRFAEKAGEMNAQAAFL
ncbi:MAG: DinB family protein, partial [Anaerolineae bacterium]|nr:DinB family protein [Anaerolineae bacterium]